MPATPFLAAVVLVTTLPVQADDKPHPIVAQVRAAVSDPAKPFTMLVHLKLKDDAGAQFEKAFAKAAVATRREKGCRTYELSRDARTPTHYLVYERWNDVAALDAHLKTAHIKTLLAEIGDLLAGPPEVQVYLPVGD